MKTFLISIITITSVLVIYIFVKTPSNSLSNLESKKHGDTLKYQLSIGEKDGVKDYYVYRYEIGKNGMKLRYFEREKDTSHQESSLTLIDSLGNVDSTCRFVKGILEGEFRKHKNGKLYRIGKYKQGFIEGMVLTLHPNGQTERCELYEKGKLMNCSFVRNIKGKELNRGTLSDGNGTLNVYDSRDKRIETRYYTNGILTKSMR